MMSSQVLALLHGRFYYVKLYTNILRVIAEHLYVDTEDLKVLENDGEGGKWPKWFLQSSYCLIQRPDPALIILFGS